MTTYLPPVTDTPAIGHINNLGGYAPGATSIVIATDQGTFPAPAAGQVFLAIINPNTLGLLDGPTTERVVVTANAAGAWTLQAPGLANAHANGEVVALILSESWLANLLQLSGGTMTGQITLPGGGTGNQAATVNQLPTAVPPVSAIIQVAHSYFGATDAGVSEPQTQNQYIGGKLAGAFHVQETNLQPIIAGSARWTIAQGCGYAGWDGVFQKVLPINAAGMLTSVGGAPLLLSDKTPAWPTTGQPPAFLCEGINSWGTPFGWTTGIGPSAFSALTFFAGSQFTGTIASAGATTITSSSNLSSSGTYLPNRVGGAGIQAGDYIAGPGIQGQVKVLSVAWNGSTTTTITLASGVPVVGGTYPETNQTYQVYPGSTSQFETAFSNAAIGIITRLISGWMVRSDDAAITYTGSGWTTTNTQNMGIGGYQGGTGPTIQTTIHNGDSLTYTIPSNFPGGALSLVFVGGSDLDNSGSTIAWTGTFSGNGATTHLGGEGWAGWNGPVVARFLLTAADAGKTIIGTFSNGTPTSISCGSVTTASGSTSITAASFPNVQNGMAVVSDSGGGIPAGTIVLSGAGTGTLVLSHAAANTVSGTDTIVFTNTICQLDNISYDATYIAPVLLANQPTAVCGVWSTEGSTAVDTAINNTVAVFNSASPPTIGGNTYPNTSAVTQCDVSVGYGQIAKVDANAQISGFWLGTTLSTAAANASNANITLIGKLTSGQAAPYVGQNLLMPNPALGGYPELMQVAAVGNQTTATITGGSPTPGTYPAWPCTLTRAITPIGGATPHVFATGLAATGSLTAPTVEVDDAMWLSTFDFLHPNAAGSSIFTAAYVSKYLSVASTASVQQAASQASWVQGRTRTTPRPLHGGYLQHKGTIVSGSTVAISSTQFAVRFSTPSQIVVDEIGCYVTTTSGVMKMYAGIFIDDQTGSMPGHAITDFGLASASLAAGGLAVVQGYQVLPPGNYWTVVAFTNGTTARVNALTAVTDDMPLWIPSSATPSAANMLGWSATTTGTNPLTSIVPSTAWSILTAAVPLIVVHAYDHVYVGY